MMAPSGAAAGTAPEDRFQKARTFERFTMAHPRLTHVKDLLLNAIRGAAPGSLVLVLGPTGVGKTTLRLKCEQVLAAEMMGCRWRRKRGPVWRAGRDHLSGYAMDSIWITRGLGFLSSGGLVALRQLRLPYGNWAIFRGPQEVSNIISEVAA